ncbi:MAG: hypothetical protein M1549_03025 [Candidatus Dependentiae bacterium]|nr:hypothetical protein [Candidatus Dependentiae bacterium]
MVRRYVKIGLFGALFFAGIAVARIGYYHYVCYGVSRGGKLEEGILRQGTLDFYQKMEPGLFPRNSIDKYFDGQPYTCSLQSEVDPDDLGPTGRPYRSTTTQITGDFHTD